MAEPSKIRKRYCPPGSMKYYNILRSKERRRRCKERTNKCINNSSTAVKYIGRFSTFASQLFWGVASIFVNAILVVARIAIIAVRGLYQQAAKPLLYGPIILLMIDAVIATSDDVEPASPSTTVNPWPWIYSAIAIGVVITAATGGRFNAQGSAQNRIEEVDLEMGDTTDQAETQVSIASNAFDPFATICSPITANNSSNVDQNSEQLSKKECTLRDKCIRCDVQYIGPERTQSEDITMRNAIERERKKIERKNESTEKKERRLQKNNERTKQAYQDALPERKRKILDSNNAAQKRSRAKKKSNSKQPTRSETDNASDPPKMIIETKKAIDKGIAFATRTRRKDGNHQASVCVICDRCIIGTETIHSMSKERILLNQVRISVKSYEEHYGEELNTTVVKQYEVADLPGLLLSPRSYREDDNFETCSSCFESMKPSKAQDSKKPPKHAIANGFVIGHIPNRLIVEDEDLRQCKDDLTIDQISDIMGAAVSRQRPYGFIFAFLGGAHQSIMGQFSFFEMDQSHIGGVINHYQSTGANKHILCALCGRFTPKQRELAKKQAQLDTGLYTDLMTWLVANHPAYADVTPPKDCPQPRLLADSPNENNTDASQNPSVEEEFGGGSFTFTSSHDPSENTGVYRDSTEFTMAILNREDPMMLAYGGKYVSSGRELRLELIFPIQFQFGIGGPKMRRPTQISELVCLQHYFRLSLPQFMRGDFILVVLHMYNRIMSYRSGLITCRSTRLNDQCFAEQISTLTEDQIKEAAKKKTDNVEDSSTARQFLEKVETSSKAIAYTTAAAKANRRLMYSLCDRFGIPGLFFSCSPCDECTFRVRVWVNAGKGLELPSLDSMTDTQCIADFNLRRDARSKYPGACALEYQSIVQILIKELFGWDTNTQTGGIGIFGELEAWAVAHEEQGRKTLHGHWLLWIKSFGKLRAMLFHHVEETKNAAREEYKKYIDSIMSSSYGDLKVNHNCTIGKSVVQENNMNVDEDDVESPQVSNGNGSEDPPRANALFYDYQPNSPKEKEQLQHIRNTRNKHRKDTIRGKILHCNEECGALFSTQDIVNMSLLCHKGDAESDIDLPMHNKRLDIATYRYSYDYGQDDVYTDGFWNTKEVRDTLLRLRMDEHDWKHRPGCFKKGPECRFHFGKCSCQETEWRCEEDDQTKSTTWYRLDDMPPIVSYPYCVETRRDMGSQFLNTHSIPVSAVFGCNTNVQVGDPCHLFYATAYAFKDTQKDDSDRFIRIGTQVIRRLHRMKRIAMEIFASENGAAHAQESQSNESSENPENPENPAPDFGEGLSRMLAGMCANMTKAVCSTTMGHLIVSNDGSRFQFSHGFTNLLISQVLDVLDGKDGQFRVRSNYSKSKKEKILWPESTVDDYLYRDEELENLSLYEFVAQYEKVYKKFKQMDKKQSSSALVDECDDACDDDQLHSDLHLYEYPFKDEHPGHEFSHLRQRKFQVIPVISMPKGSICRIEDLKVHSSTPTECALENREVYARAALVLGFPFRSSDDLRSLTNGTHWRKFVDSINDNTYWKTGKDILHNIEERETAQKMKSAPEPLASKTDYEPVDEDEIEDKRTDNSNPNAIDFSLFDDEDERMIDNDYKDNEGYAQRTERTHGHLIDLGDVDKSQMISARISGQDSLLAASDETPRATSTQRRNQDTTSASGNGVEYPTLLTFIDGALVGGNYDTYATFSNTTDATLTGEAIENEDDAFHGIQFNDSQDSTNRVIPTLSGVAKKIAQQEGKTLDKKQYITYEIIVCSFLLSLLYEGMDNPASTLRNMDNSQRETLIERLRARGGQDQLVMFLSGFAGAGKSTCVKVAQRFCFEFCRAVSIPWNANTYLFTATTGSAASLFEGQTIHDAAFLNGKEKNISNKKRQEWQNVRILIIDEISFFTRTNLEKLDRRLKIILGRQDLPYGGVSVVFSGDFHQLRPVRCESHGILYDGVMNGLFEGSINTAVILEDSHRFDEDPEYGELMKRIWRGEVTEEDIEMINSRRVGKNGVTLPEDGEDADTCYACPFNKQRNATSAGIFREHLRSGLFPSIDSDDLPPDHTIIIEADIQSSKSSDGSGKTRVSREMRDRIINTCGDSHVVTGQNKKVDPCLRVYPGAHAMCNDNSKLKKENIGNGTLCRVKKIKLKNGVSLQWKNWEGVKVYTVNARYVEWVEFERFPDNEKIIALKSDITTLEEELASGSDDDKLAQLDKLRNELKATKSARCFRLSPVKSTAEVHVSLDDAVSERAVLKGVSMTQLPINMNDATTGHKLQGMSKDKLIVVSWSLIPNWIYVVLSRVRTLNGLFILKPMPKHCLDSFQVPRELQAFEQRMRSLEHSIIEAREQNMAALNQSS